MGRMSRYGTSALSLDVLINSENGAVKYSKKPSTINLLSSWLSVVNIFDSPNMLEKSGYRGLPLSVHDRLNQNQPKIVKPTSQGMTALQWLRIQS